MWEERLSFTYGNKGTSGRLRQMKNLTRFKRPLTRFKRPRLKFDSNI